MIDEYWVVAKEIFDPKDDMALLHIIDRLSLTEYFWFNLGFTRIITVITLGLIHAYRNYSLFCREPI